MEPRLGQWMLGWLTAVAVTYTLASIAHTQRVLSALTDLGVPIGFGERLDMTTADLSGLRLYAILIGVALAIGLLVSQAIPRRLLPLPPLFRHALAGGVAMAALLLAMKASLSYSLIAGARGSVGLALQCLAGLAGGWTHAVVLERLTARR